MAISFDVFLQLNYQKIDDENLRILIENSAFSPINFIERSKKMNLDKQQILRMIPFFGSKWNQYNVSIIRWARAINKTPQIAQYYPNRRTDVKITENIKFKNICDFSKLTALETFELIKYHPSYINTCCINKLGPTHWKFLSRKHAKNKKFCNNPIVKMHLI